MIDISNGRYWDLPWSLVDGCTPCSPGCDHCWSAVIAHRFFREGEPGYCAGILTDDKGRFNGDIITHPERLYIPLTRRRPTVYAVWNDLFHEAVSYTFIGRALSYAIGEFRHTFLVLTKRPQRMADLMGRFYAECDEKSLRRAINVYCGLTICNQEEADEKIPVFLQVPGKKFLSIEPMLGPIDLSGIALKCLESGTDCGGGMQEKRPGCWKGNCMGNAHVDAVILGGETSPGARPIHPDWARSVQNQCAAANVPFFFKGWGEWLPVYDRDKDDPDFRKCDGVKLITPQGRWLNRAGGQGFHGARVMRVDRIGKKRAGRLLDGQTYDDLPWNK